MSSGSFELAAGVTQARLTTLEAFPSVQIVISRWTGGKLATYTLKNATMADIVIAASASSQLRPT